MSAVWIGWSEPENCKMPEICKPGWSSRMLVWVGHLNCTDDSIGVYKYLGMIAIISYEFLSSKSHFKKKILIYSLVSNKLWVRIRSDVFHQAHSQEFLNTFPFVHQWSPRQLMITPHSSDSSDSPFKTVCGCVILNKDLQDTSEWSSQRIFSWKNFHSGTLPVCIE